MRILSRLTALTALTAAAAVLFTACSGGDDQAQPQPQPEPQAAAQTEADAQAQPAAAQAGAAAQAQAPQASASLAGDASLEEVYAAYLAWYDAIDTMQVSVANRTFFFGVALNTVTEITVQIDPFTAYVVTDASAAGLFDGEDEDSSEQQAAGDPFITQTLVTPDAVYYTVTGYDGWFDITDIELGALSAVPSPIVFDPEDYTDPDGLVQAFVCVRQFGGSITEGTSGETGEAVWFVECIIEAEELEAAVNRFLQPGGGDGSSGGDDDSLLPIETLSMTALISQATGAPLQAEMTFDFAPNLFDTPVGSDDQQDQQAADELTADDEPSVRNRIRVSRWNEPVTFPEPTPLLAASLLAVEEPAAADDAGSQSGGLGLSGDLGLFAAAWAGRSDELELHTAVEAVIDGTVRTVESTIRRSLSQSAYERAVRIDGAAPIRLLWNEDGIWLSPSGSSAWRPTTPAELGFGSQTIVEYLLSTDPFSYRLLQRLPNLSPSGSETISSSAGVDRMALYFDELSPNDQAFRALSEAARQEAAELLADSLEITQVTSFQADLDIRHSDSGETSLGTLTLTATLQTNLGEITLTSTKTNQTPNTPIQFSQPR